MTTPAAVLREVIDGAIARVHPEPLRLEDIYRAVEAELRLDEDDLRPISLTRAEGKEPSWKRNVRNVLQHAKRSGTLVNIRHEQWRLPTPQPRLHLDESTAWDSVRIAAEKAQSHAVIYASTKQGQRYQVREVASSRLIIDRLDSPADETLRSGEVRRAIAYLNAAGGRVGRRTLIYTVAKEVSLVFLHPRLAWSEDREWIEVVGVDAAPAAAPRTYQPGSCGRGNVGG